jgi:hypothetical protein
MSVTETVIAGTLQPDGTLVLDQKPNLPAGRVMVVLRPAAEIVVPTDDPFWQRMQAMWAIPTATAAAGDGGASTLAEVAKIREEWDEHQQAIERLQEECRLTRNAPETP